MRSLPTGLEQPDHTLIGLDRRTTLSFTLKLITPMFGGSATAGKVDPDRPVTAKSIRGQLRFWWRACRAGAFESTEALYQEEARIWGGAAEYDSNGKVTQGPGAVDLMVMVVNRGQLIPCASYERQENNPKCYRGMPTFRRDYPTYALFPFQGKLGSGQTVIEEAPAEALEELTFTLRATVRRGYSDDVWAALRAWVWFGGIGARTRRGCGSLYCEEVGTPFGKQTDALRQALFLPAQSRANLIPQLAGGQMLMGEQGGHLQKWSSAVELMRDFRQKVDFARNPGQQPNRPGRSRWPEADSIRQRRGQWAQNHAPAHRALPYYPRADLGLPIVFHYQSHQDPGEPDSIVQGAGEKHTRMASPFITKAIAVSATQSVPVLIWLNAPRIYDAGAPGTELTGPGGGRLSRSEIVDPDKADLVEPLGGVDDVRRAFWKYAIGVWPGAREVTI